MFGVLSLGYNQLKEHMKVSSLPKDVTLYKISQELKIKPSAVYKWKNKNEIPKLREYQLKELHPEWFVDVKEEE